MLVFGGVDPGKTGAICMLFQTSSNEEFIRFIDNKTDPIEIVNKLSSVKDSYEPNFYIEDVHSLYGMSAKSNFSFGRQVERASLLLYLSKIPIHLVQPKVWQTTVGMIRTKQSSKIDAFNICKNLYPTIIPELLGPRGGIKDGRVDALLIAYYAKLIYGEQNGT